MRIVLSNRLTRSGAGSLLIREVTEAAISLRKFCELRVGQPQCGLAVAEPVARDVDVLAIEIPVEVRK